MLFTSVYTLRCNDEFLDIWVQIIIYKTKEMVTIIFSFNLIQERKQILVRNHIVQCIIQMIVIFHKFSYILNIRFVQGHV